jgi:hypothetical protein
MNLCHCAIKVFAATAPRVTNLFFTHAGAPVGCGMTANRVISHDVDVALRVGDRRVPNAV